MLCKPTKEYLSVKHFHSFVTSSCTEKTYFRKVSTLGDALVCIFLRLKNWRTIFVSGRMKGCFCWNERRRGCDAMGQSNVRDKNLSVWNNFLLLLLITPRPALVKFRLPGRTTTLRQLLQRRHTFIVMTISLQLLLTFFRFRPVWQKNIKKK